MPGDDGCCSTSQLIEAAFGSMFQEKLATQRQVTERSTLENRVTRSELLSRSELSKGLAAIVDAIVSRLMAAQQIPRSVKEDLLKDLSSWPLILEQVAGSQTRLGRNGKHPDKIRFEPLLADGSFPQHRCASFCGKKPSSYRAKAPMISSEGG